MISLRSTYLSCALLALSAAPAFCTSVFYADSTSWTNAVSSPTTLTFDGAGSAVGSYSTGAGFTTGLVLTDDPTFVGTEVVNGTSGDQLLILDSTASQYNNFGSGNSLWWAALSTFTTSSVLQVTFPTPVTAFALNLMTSGGSGLAYNIKLNNNPSLLYTTNPTPAWPNQSFFGIVSDTPVTSISIFLPTTGSSGVTPLIDNFSYALTTQDQGQSGDPGQIPEPRSFILIASGLIITALLRKRGRHTTAQASLV